MVDAPDIITYVGVPLAVLGVIPIFYTCMRSILALRSIRHALKTNGLSETSITRGSLMSGIIEVEIPRRRISPLDRELDAAYWTLNPHRISLPGGSWATFEWNQLLTVRVLYRCQYKEELRVPPAEIVFEELVTFLLDRGAVPEPKGWKVLKSIGLWTPTGTVLLRAPTAGREVVLRLAPPYDGDGILRLAVQWRKEWDFRDVSSLPPFWMRLARPRWDYTREAKVMNLEEADQLSESGSSPSLLAQIEELHISSDSEDLSDGVRFHAERGHVQTVYFERNGQLTGKHQRLWTSTAATSAGAWFSWTASALSQKSDAGLWNVSIPAETTLFASTKASIPGGVLVLLDLIDSEAIPPFAEPPPDTTVDIMQRHRSFVESQQQRALEDTLPPAQAAEARRKRAMAQTQSFHEQSMKAIQARREYEEKRMIGALNSQPLQIAVVAEKCRLYLIASNVIPAGYMLEDLVRAILYLIIVSAEAAKSIADVLEQWQSWSERSGLNKQNLEILKTNKIWFCYAAALLAIIDQAGRSESQLSLDMMECLKIWHTVHLG